MEARGISWHGLSVCFPLLPVTWTGYVAGRGWCFGQNNPPSSWRGQGVAERERERWRSDQIRVPIKYYAVELFLSFWYQATESFHFPGPRCCSAADWYLSSSLIWLRVLDRKRLIMISALSVLISWVKPLSSPASVHVVKAVYGQWPDMKPRLWRSCKQPHLFESTCSPLFTGPVNNEINPAYYCITNSTADPCIKSHANLSAILNKTLLGVKVIWKKSIWSNLFFSPPACMHLARYPFISIFIYLYISLSVCFHFSPLNLATLRVTAGQWAKTKRRSGSEWSLSLTFTGGFTYHPWLEGHGSHYETSAGGAPWYILHLATMDLCIQ